MRYREVTFKDSEGLQDRATWLQWRHQGIGSSDAAVVAGVSRFNDWDTLLSQKSLLEPLEDNQNTYIKERGNRIEFQVRMFLEQKWGEEYAAKNCEHITFPFIRASLDGCNKSGQSICEIKLLSSVNPAKVNTEAEGYKKWVAACGGVVPLEYYPQIQHQLFVTGAEVCFFVGYKEEKGNQVVTEDKLAIVPVYPDKVYQRELLNKCFNFWLEVVLRRDELQYKGELE